MASRTIEDYLKQILLLQQRQSAGAALVPMGALAEAMAVTPGTATSMVKRLADAALLDYEPYAGVRLTTRGRKLGTQVLRRHRLIETFLVEVLGLDWSEVHEEAEQLEHALSEKLLERIDAVLNHPTVDPHGDPIPSADGRMGASAHASLAECGAGDIVRIARVTDQNDDFLQYVDKQGLRPGAKVTVQERSSSGGSITVKASRRDAVTLGTNAAEKLLVERQG